MRVGRRPPGRCPRSFLRLHDTIAAMIVAPIAGRSPELWEGTRGCSRLMVYGAAGVAPPPLPPQQGAQGSEDEEGMDEPPEVRDFLQELGEGGGRGSGGEDASSGALPTVWLPIIPGTVAPYLERVEDCAKTLWDTLSSSHRAMPESFSGVSCF